MYVCTPHLKACDHTKLNINFPWCDLWMSFKGPHDFTVMALGHSLKWPLTKIFEPRVLSPFVAECG